MQQKMRSVLTTALLMLLLSMTNIGTRAGGVVSSTATDAYENDNTPAQATRIVAGDAAQWHGISTAGDVDWVHFPIQAGQVYRLTATPLTSFAVAFQWQGNALVRQVNQTLVITARGDSDFYVAVQAVDGCGAPDRVYLLQLTDLPVRIEANF